jgi:DNA-binding CsgD family transcriptional regulator/predicted negative regulator of RcsB-dependent stress response
MFIRGAWSAAFDLMSSIDGRLRLDSRGLETFATAAYMIGREATFCELLERAFDAHRASAETLRAARSAFWIGLTLMFRGEHGRGSGWLQRAERLVDEHGEACVERGYILLPRVEGELARGDLAAAGRFASEAIRVGEEFADEDLVAIARHLKGRIEIESGNIAEGVSHLDETMVAAIGGRLSPIVTGLLYCSVIDICQSFQIPRRAKEWTDALTAWCGSQPELIAFTGRCLIHRSEILIFDGQWTEAFAEAGTACHRLLDGPVEHHAGPAFYLKGEVLRLRGRFTEADESYRSASRLGFDPQPGHALMRLRQGKSQAAHSSIKRALAAVRDPVGRMRLLPAAVEITLAVGDVAAARDLCDELSGLAARYASEAIAAAAAEAIGDVRVAEGKSEDALLSYGRAAELWRELHAPYRLSRLRLKIGRTCQALGDGEGAERETEAAQDMFDKLGAEPDRKAAEAMLLGLKETKATLLTPRQIEVLQLVAEGLTNREIAERLGLSERTVDRHVSDTLTRIDVPTRAAATAFALSRGLIRPAG